MQIYIVDAFTTKIFSGNQAGVVMLDEDEFLPDAFMLDLAGELKHSETAFLKRRDECSFDIRYFTPEAEVDLCGHATIASFVTLYRENVIDTGVYSLYTKKEKLAVWLDQGYVWMEMGSPMLIRDFNEEEAAELYQAYGLTKDHMHKQLRPKIIQTGLADIFLPVNSEEDLANLKQDSQRVKTLSEKYQVTGVHAFVCGDKASKQDYTAKCRNFAPLFGIEEEAATGTSNGGLAYFLYLENIVKMDEVHVFLQGEEMGKSSVIKSALYQKDNKCFVKIGGTARISMKGKLMPNE